MTWKPSDHVDEQVRGLDAGQAPTRRIARIVLEHNPAFVILYHLDRLNVARRMRTNQRTHIDGACTTA
jgi:hypothetical protein